MEVAMPDGEVLQGRFSPDGGGGGRDSGPSMTLPTAQMGQVTSPWCTEVRPRWSEMERRPCSASSTPRHLADTRPARVEPAEANSTVFTIETA
jgi:hypothetical protein